MTNQRRVLTDAFGAVRWNLTEGTQEQGSRLYVEGKIGQCDTPTANGRIYGRKIMEREVERLQPRIESSALVGSLDHPGDGKSRLRDAVHICRALKIESDGAIHGRFEIVEECDNGRNLAAFLRRGAAIGMSSRGMGSTTSGTKGEAVGDDFRLSTFDFVADPAVSDAYPAIVNEDIDVSKVTVEDITKRFPEQVKALQESAYAVAQQTLEQDREEEEARLLQQTAEETLRQYKDNARTEVHEEVKAELTEEMALKLTRALQGLRKDVEEQVRAEFASDPTVASAKFVLEQIAKLTHPFTPPKDVAAIIAEKDATIEELLTRSKSALEARDSLDATGRKLAFALFVEREIGQHAQAESIREMVGDVSSYESTTALREAVARAVSAHDDAQERAEAKNNGASKRLRQLETELASIKENASRRDKLTESAVGDLKKRIAEREAEHERALSALEERNAQLTEGLQEAANLAEELQVARHASEATQGHPRRSEVLDLVRTRRPKTAKAVNQLVESETPPNLEAVGLRDRIRQNLGHGRGPGALQEDTQARTAKTKGSPNAQSVMLESELGELGVELGDIKMLMNGKNRRG